MLSPLLYQLLDVCGLEFEKNLDSIVEVTQKHFLRPKNLERWDLPNFDTSLEKSILHIGKSLGFIEEITPTKNYYDYSFVHGGPFFCMQHRLNYLVELWKRGVRFKELFFLLSERPLNPSHEPKDCEYKTENEAMHFLWEHNENIPEEIKSIRTHFIDVPMIKEGEEVRRPNTRDTLLKWQELKKPKGSALFVSSQPFCKYQHAVAMGCMGDFPFLETVGPHPEEEDKKAAVILDSVARWLYQERSNLKNHLQTSPVL